MVDQEIAFIENIFSKASNLNGSCDVIKLPGLLINLKYIGCPVDFIDKIHDAFPRFLDNHSSSKTIDLTVICDSDSLGQPPDVWPFEINGRDAFQRVFWSSDKNFVMIADEIYGIWNMIDFRKNQHLMWIKNIESLPSWEYAAPFRHHIHLHSLQFKSTLIHAGAWASNESAILLTGPGGVGKSTTTIAAAHLGFSTFSEDLAWVEFKDNAHFIKNLYTTFKVTKNAKENYPFIADFVNTHPHADYEKILVHTLGNDLKSLPIKAIYCLSGSFSDNTTIEPCSKSLAFRLLAPSTLFLMRTANQETLILLKEMIFKLPTFKIILGKNPLDVVPAINDHASQII